MHGQFVRALGTVFHLNCFKCMVRRLYFCLHHSNHPHAVVRIVVRWWLKNSFQLRAQKGGPSRYVKRIIFAG